MATKLKALGLALAAAFALSAVAASAASADEVHSGSATGNTWFTVDNHVTNALDTPAGNISCTTITGHAKITGTTATQATLTGIVYHGCTAFGLTAHVDMMGCDYLLTGVGATTGTIHIVCPELGAGVTDKITITPTQGGAAICHIEIAAQTISANIGNTGETVGGIPDDIHVTPTGTVTYQSTRTAGGSKCPTEGHHNDGTYTGSVTVQAFQNAAHNERVGLTYT